MKTPEEALPEEQETELDAEQSTLANESRDAEESAQPQVSLNPRAEQLNAIARENMASVMGDTALPVSPAESADDNELPAEEEVSTEGTEETGLPSEPDYNQAVTRTINGVPVTLSMEQWLQRASKISAADQYLADAKEQARQAQLAPPPAVPAIDAKALQPHIDQWTNDQDMTLEQLADNIAESMKPVVSPTPTVDEPQQNASPPLTPDQVAQIAAQQLEARDFQNTVGQMVQTDPALASFLDIDHPLGQLTNRHSAALEIEQPGLSMDQHLALATQRARAEATSALGVPAAQPSRAEQQQRSKVAIGNSRAGHVQVPATPARTQTPKSGNPLQNAPAAIEQMQKLRMAGR